MSKKIFLCFFLLMASFVLKCQNIIPNFSFEDTIHCPDAYFYFEGYVSNWSGIEPGYFSPYCDDGGLGGMPENTWGYQYPHTGQAYTGIYTFWNAGNDTSNPYYSEYHNERDYLQDSLISQLKAGVRYYVTFYASLGDSEQYACNNIGAYFSDSSLVFSRHVLWYHTPQIQNDTSQHLTDKINWMKISGSFIAKGGEKYIVIGNFNTDSQVDTIFVNSSASHVTYNDWEEAYYYIDDVIVSADSNYADSLLTATKAISKPKENVMVYPNPNSGVFNFEMQNINTEVGLDIYNALGQKVFSKSSIRSLKFSIDISSQSSGIYFYRITDINGNLVKGDKVMIVH